MINIKKYIIKCCYFVVIVGGSINFVKCSLEDNEIGAGLNPYIKKKFKDTSAGDPLFLTPFIEHGRYEEGRKEADVPSLIPKQHIKSYAGYLTVNKKYNSNLFFWYFQSEGNPNSDPTVVWLQGGPGSSSLFGLFNENGPYIINSDGSISKREHTWSKVSNLIYFDNPVGTGYSFTDDELGYARNESQVGDDLYEAIVQLFTLFPNLQKNDFYITGESYAGKYVPAFAHAIFRKNMGTGTTALRVKLSGLFIGNGWTDPINMLKYSDYLYQLGLIDDNARREFRKIESEAVKNIKRKNWPEASKLVDRLVGDETSLYYKYTGLTGYYNYYNIKSGDWENYEEQFITADYFRNAVHVGNKKYNNGLEVYRNLYEDVPKSVIGWVAQLLRDYRVLFYNGQLDIICAYPLTENYLSKMVWPLSKKYKKAKRYIYRVNDEVAGYYKSVGHLTEVLIRNAGHMVPTDQPVSALQLLIDFMHKNITNHKEEISNETFKKHIPYHKLI